MIEPGSPEWLSVISPSKVAAILGVSRWESPYRLWHRMKGLVPPEPPKDIFDDGHDAEHLLAARWRRLNPEWQLSHGEVQVAHDRFGFPVVATVDRRARRGSHRRVVEFKTARTLTELEEWGDPDLSADEPPDDYLVQVITQQHFTGYTDHAAHLMMLGPYFKHRTYVVEYNPTMGYAIEQKCAEWWESLRHSTPPDLDDTVPTYECVRQRHPDIDGSTAVLDPALAAAWLDTDRESKDIAKRLRGLKTRTLDRMGNSQYAIAVVTRDGIPVELPVADRRSNGKGSISLYPNTKTSTDLLKGITV